MTTLNLPFSGNEAADRLLEEDPLALLIGMVLDQQIPLEKAFHGPLVLRERMGGGPLDVRAIADADEESIVAWFATPPAIHRFPASMGTRVQEVCRHLVEVYDGRAQDVWETAADGNELLARVKAMPGFGDQKAKIFVALLGKRLGVAPEGWAEAAGPYGEPGSFRSVADIDGPGALAQVRAYKKEMKAAARAAAESSPPTLKPTLKPKAKARAVGKRRSGSASG
ncbi:MAG TPA: HhH-GPD-type base excision DNA repair protein [Acidimicrobiales bacterium]|nr:HhH-GPD-type base excision DNA repair protein [Acidimicrobiales bacterium]